MFKKIFLFLVAGMFILGISKVSFAMMCSSGGHSSNQQTAQADTEHKDETSSVTDKSTTEELVDAGNKICPVSGEKIKEGEVYQVEHEGKIYNLCCKACQKDFKKDPGKYIEKLEQMEEEKKTQEKHQGHSEHPGGHHE